MRRSATVASLLKVTVDTPLGPLMRNLVMIYSRRGARWSYKLLRGESSRAVERLYSYLKLEGGIWVERVSLLYTIGEAEGVKLCEDCFNVCSVLNSMAR